MEDIKVRIGTVEDVDGMMALAKAASEENGFLFPNLGKMLYEIYAGLARDHGVVGIIGEDKSNLEGAVLLRIVKTWYSDQDFLEEKAIFIHPDYRAAKGGRARKLCEFSKKMADGLGLPLLIGVLSNHRTEGKVRLYERQFGPPAGAYFLYNATTGFLKESDDGRRRR